VAKSRRRDEDAVDGRLDDVLDDDVLDDDVLDEDELDADLVDDDELDAELVDTDDDEESDAGRSRTATRRRAAGSAKKVGVTKKSTWTRDLERVGVFARLRNFVREVVAELRKVIWPTRKELLTYTAVVIVFVTIMFSIVASLDYGFGKAMFLIFGNKK
jgi:preprotein translocase subunit SecE